MARKAFLLRIEPAVLAALQAWAEQDLRSLNGQIEFLLREALTKRGVKLGPESADGGEGRDGAGTGE